MTCENLEILEVYVSGILEYKVTFSMPYIGDCIDMYTRTHMHIQTIVSLSFNRCFHLCTPSCANMN